MCVMCVYRMKNDTHTRPSNVNIYEHFMCVLVCNVRFARKCIPLPQPNMHTEPTQKRVRDLCAQARACAQRQQRGQIAWTTEIRN